MLSVQESTYLLVLLLVLDSEICQVCKFGNYGGKVSEDDYLAGIIEETYTAHLKDEGTGMI